MKTSSTINLTPSTRPVTRISEPTAVTARVGLDIDLAAVAKWVAITDHAHSFQAQPIEADRADDSVIRYKSFIGCSVEVRSCTP